MQRVRTYQLLIAAFIEIGVAGCQKKAPTVSYYLHDIDAAHAKLQEAKRDPIKAQNDPATENASAAWVQAISSFEFSSGIGKCWHKELSTATTDHACLDAHGYKR